MSGELGPEARGILDAGRDGDDPTAGDRARVRASLMQAIAVGGGATVGLGAVGKASASVAPKAAAGAAAAAKTVSTFGAAKIVGVVMVVAAVGGSGIAISKRVATKSVAPTSTQVAEQPAERPAARAIGGAVAAPAATAESPAAPKTDDAPAAEVMAATPRPTPIVARPPSATAPAPSAAEADPLAVETRQIAEANRATQAGDPDRALAILDSRPPGSDGQMTEERSVARVLALCKAGRATEARATASRFVAEHPSSPSVDRMRHACADGDR